MAQVSTTDVVNIFKRQYGDLSDLQPKGFPLGDMIPFSQKQKTGEFYVEGVVLTSENGFSILGSGAEAYDINPAVAGTVKQISVESYQTALPSVVPWGLMTRSAGAGDKAFVDATKHIVANNLKSHNKLLEIIRHYGRSPGFLGTVTRFTQTYRGVSFTAGTGTLGGVAFTNGVSASAKALVFSPGTFAAGVWVGSEGVAVEYINNAGTVVSSGKVVGVDTDNGILYLDFAPSAPGASETFKVGFKGMADSRDAFGLEYILNSPSSLWGVNTSQYSLFKPTVHTLSSTKFSFQEMQKGIAKAVNRSGLEGNLQVRVNPRTWATLMNDETALRTYDSSYSPKQVEKGSESIKFYSQAGTIEIKADRYLKEGLAYAVQPETWSRSGSQDVSFTIAGVGQEVIFPLENQTAFAFRSFADQYLFCNKPGFNILFSGINDEA